MKNLTIIIAISTALIALSLQPASAGSIRKWKDKDGVTHFGSAPPNSAEGVERVYLSPGSSYSSGSSGRSASQQLRAMEGSRIRSNNQYRSDRQSQRSTEEYRARTGQDYAGKKEIRRLQKQKESIAHQMRNARGSKASSLQQKMRSTDDAISRKQGYRPPARAIININNGRR